MRKLLFIALSLSLMSIVLFGCNRQSNVPQTSASESSERENPYILNMLGLKINDEQYGGLYIEEGIYHINIVGETDEFQDNVNLDNVKLHSVNYSLKHLNEVYKVLTDHMHDFDISVIAIDEKDNKVYIYIKDINDSKLDKIKKIIDSPVIEARAQVLDIKLN